MERIFKRQDGRWEGHYIKARNGKKAVVYGYVFGKSYSEVKKKESEAFRRIDSDKTQLKKPVQAKNPIFKHVTCQWLEELKPVRKHSTIVKYASQLKNYIIPMFGNMALNNIINDNVRWCSQSRLSHINMQHICTAAIYDDVFFAYRVAIPHQLFSLRNVFST